MSKAMTPREKEAYRFGYDMGKMAERDKIVDYLVKEYCDVHEIAPEDFGDMSKDNAHYCGYCWPPEEVLAIREGKHHE